MAGSVLVDAGFLVALLSRREQHHRWAAAQSRHLPLPWKSCESVLSEAFHLMGRRGTSTLAALIRRRALVSDFEFHSQAEAVLKLMQKYGDIPMSLADACLVRMTEVLPDPILATTDSDFRVYRRSGRQVVPTVMPF